MHPSRLAHRVRAAIAGLVTAGSGLASGCEAPPPSSIDCVTNPFGEKSVYLVRTHPETAAYELMPSLESCRDTADRELARTRPGFGIGRAIARDLGR